MVSLSSGSQEERISILRMALAEKGFPVDSHAAGVGQPQVTSGQEDMSQQHLVRQPVDTVLGAATHSDDVVVDEDGGIDL